MFRKSTYPNPHLINLNFCLYNHFNNNSIDIHIIGLVDFSYQELVPDFAILQDHRLTTAFCKSNLNNLFFFAESCRVFQQLNELYNCYISSCRNNNIFYKSGDHFKCKNIFKFSQKAKSQKNIFSKKIFVEGLCRTTAIQLICSNRLLVSACSEQTLATSGKGGGNIGFTVVRPIPINKPNVKRLRFCCNVAGTR